MKFALVFLSLFIFERINISNKIISAGIVKRGIDWQKENWAFGCDFTENNLMNVKIRGEDCGGRCVETSECTHFTWTTWNGGTCWMKKGKISKSDAFLTNDNTMVCGVINNENSSELSKNSNRIGQILEGVVATRHSAVEVGACSLPPSNYAVVYPVALGNIESLKHLKFRPDLCGQVLRVDCGHGSLDIIVTNSNHGGGLDLYSSTWDKLTNNESPGETLCNVQLTSRNTFNFNGFRCFYKPGTDINNRYFHNIGLLNTNGRIVTRATIDNQVGEHQGENPYYSFNFGPIDDNKEVIFTFEDGKIHKVSLSDCEYQSEEPTWT